MEWMAKSVFGGIAIGKLMIFRKTDQTVKREKISDAKAEVERFYRAREDAKEQLKVLHEKALQEVGQINAAIFEVHQMMLDDLDYVEAVVNMIETQSINAEFAVATTGDNFSAMFSAMDDEYMRERAADVRDVAARICRILSGEAEHTITAPCLIAAEELTPSQTVQFPRELVLGMLTARGAANSHTGILARTLGVPAVSQLPVSRELHGHTAILDGFSGTLTLDPDEKTLAEANVKIAAQQAQREALRQLISAPSVTRDGRSIRLYANIAGTDDLPLLQRSGAEGVGLLRSEFL